MSSTCNLVLTAALVFATAACNAASSTPAGLAPPDGKYGDSPRIAPDGKSIAFIMSAVGGSDDEQLAVMGVDGTGVTVVATPATYLAGLAWSPDGRKIYYTSDKGILMVGSTGGAGAAMVTNAFAAMTPDVSPDGKTLVWAENGGSMHTLDLETPGASPVVLGEGGGPRFSPDGKSLLFIKRDEAYTLALLDLSTQRVTDIVATDTYLASAAWFSDGLRIACVWKEGIDVVTVADKSRKHIVDQFASKSLDISRDDKTIVYAVNGMPNIFVLTGF